MRVLKTFVIVGLILLSVQSLSADPGNTTVPNPGEQVLLIYTDCTSYATQIRDAWVAALGSIVPAPTITQLLVPCGNRNGIWDEMQAKGWSNLSQFCEVYDLRFRDDRNNLAFDGVIWEDVLTFTGANNDWQIFTAFLNSGGHLYMQGEHHDYYCRNTNLIGFINSVAVTPIGQSRANVMNGATTITTFLNATENFATDFNTLAGSMNGNYVGGISLTSLGSARALVTKDLGASSDPVAAPGGNSAVWMGYLAGDLVTNGKLVVGWETNGYTEATLKNAVSDNVLKNIYDFLSACYKYTITKTFVPDTLCVGDAGTFTLCYNNTGMSVPSVTLWDTIPSVLTVNSTSVPPTGNTAVTGGRLYWWTFAPLAAGANACITINFTVNAMP